MNSVRWSDRLDIDREIVFESLASAFDYRDWNDG